MANLSDNKPVYNKAFSYKTISGGSMRVGSLVRSKLEPCSLGLITELFYDEESYARIIWVRDEIEPMYTHIEETYCLEVICE